MTAAEAGGDPPSTSLEAPVYVYGVVRAGSFGARDVHGVANRPVVTVDSNDGLAALVSELADEGLRVRRRDLIGHLRVLETAFAETTIVPCAFGMVLQSRAAVAADFLDARRAQLLALLERLEGRVQLNVTVGYDEEEVFREIVVAEPEIAKLRARSRDAGAAGHFERIRLGELVSAALAQRRAADEQRLLARLIPESDDVVVEPGGDTTALKASFLVDRRRSDRFDAALESLAATEAPRLTFESIGPLPPTAFASLEAGG